MALANGDGIPLIQERITINNLSKMKEKGEAITALSLYDASLARFFDEAGGEVIVVGDSASMAAMGRPNTLPITMEEMLVFSRSVCRGTKRLFVVGDMPLGSYEVSSELAVQNALRFMKDVGDRPCNAVKVEINMDYIERVREIAKTCLVVAHIGLNPNKAEMLGGYRTLGKTKQSAEELCEVALAAEEAKACMILIESVPEEVSQVIRESVKIPVLGIAAGRKLDGQLLIGADLLDFYEWPGNRKPRHFKIYKTEKSGLTPGGLVREAFSWYVRAVKSGEMPGEENVHFLPNDDRPEVARYLRDLRSNRANQPVF
ncbi:MAG: 3-methyl-2-oxobutanoate hydroxymethyltransferase [Elusimicrobia bacterium]|nr:3-methyl-2-oxobutanoate hydroxymethyltransferase [Elusimicrobiota bacterium]